jgi:hypothetical protein
MTSQRLQYSILERAENDHLLDLNRLSPTRIIVLRKDK